MNVSPIKEALVRGANHDYLTNSGVFNASPNSHEFGYYYLEESLPLPKPSTLIPLHDEEW